jgi:hypothetical protein
VRVRVALGPIASISVSGSVPFSSRDTWGQRTFFFQTSIHSDIMIEKGIREWG